MDIEEWRKRYQEILTAVENATIKTREETEKNDKGELYKCAILLQMGLVNVSGNSG